MSDGAKIVNRWKGGTVTEQRIKDVLLVLEENGFTVRQASNGHYVASHEKLRDNPRFPTRMITINAHAFGKQGQVHPNAIRDILAAIKWVNNQ